MNLRRISPMIASTALTAPSLHVDMPKLPLIDRSLARKVINAYIDEASKLIRSVGIEPVPIEKLAEDSYIMCSDPETLLYIGRFNGGIVPSDAISKAMDMCRESAVMSLHTHPIPLHIPTPEDIISSEMLGLGIECVLCRFDNRYARALCVKPKRAWYRVVRASEMILEKIFESISRYVVVDRDGHPLLLPYPSIEEAKAIEEMFIVSVQSEAEVLVLEIDLLRKQYLEMLYT